MTKKQKTYLGPRTCVGKSKIHLMISLQKKQYEAVFERGFDRFEFKRGKEKKRLNGTISLRRQGIRIFFLVMCISLVPYILFQF